MSIEKGRLVTCDRCGYKEFLPDGDSDHGWNYINSDALGRHELCPVCDKAFCELVTSFVENPEVIHTKPDFSNHDGSFDYDYVPDGDSK